MKYLGYIRSVFIAILTIYIAYLLLDLFYDDFEILTISILILIYINIRNLGTGMGRGIEGIALALRGEFKKIRVLLHSNYIDEEIEDEIIDEATQKIKDNTFDFYVRIITNAIIYIMVILKIFNVVS